MNAAWNLYHFCHISVFYLILYQTFPAFMFLNYIVPTEIMREENEKEEKKCCEAQCSRGRIETATH